MICPICCKEYLSTNNSSTCSISCGKKLSIMRKQSQAEIKYLEESLRNIDASLNPKKDQKKRFRSKEVEHLIKMIADKKKCLNQFVERHGVEDIIGKRDLIRMTKILENLTSGAEMLGGKFHDQQKAKT